MRCDDDSVDVRVPCVPRDCVGRFAVGDHRRNRYAEITKMAACKLVESLLQTDIVRWQLPAQDANLRHVNRDSDRLANVYDVYRRASRLGQ